MTDRPTDRPTEHNRTATATPPPTLSRMPRCRLCTCILTDGDDTERRLCVDCQERPEAKRVNGTATVAARSTSTPPMAVKTEPLSVAERALVQKTHGFLPTADLLNVLNSRRIADRGAAAVPVTLEQIHAEVQAIPQPPANGDWSSLRRIIADARASGLLAQITPQIVDDFATVFQLAPAQVMHLRDVIRNAKEDR